MADFASATMGRILAAGLRELGLQAPPLSVSQRDGRIALADKRLLLEHAVAQAGLAVLPRLGSAGLPAVRGEPVHQALAGSRSAEDLLARWSRLERYVHSRHRLRWTLRDETVALQHVSLHAGESPRLAESLAVVGVLAAALAEAGFAPERASVEGVPVLPSAQEQLLRPLGARDAGIEWLLELAPARLAPVGPGAPPLASDGGLPQAWGRVPRALAAVLREGLVAPPSLAEAAQALGRSPRDLQRALAADGASYSEVLAHLRCATAAQQLLATTHPVAEIGFLCGFSDQAHFTRSFRQRASLPPALYRREFARQTGARPGSP